jgi:hypothetical protein
LRKPDGWSRRQPTFAITAERDSSHISLSNRRMKP